VDAIIRRLIQLVVVLVIVTFFTAILSALLPGDPVKTIAPFATDQQRAEIRDTLGLDDNIVVRYGRWLGNFVHGDMGREYAGAGVQGPSVYGIVKTSLPRSLLLMVYVQLLTLLIAVPLGIYTAYRAGTRVDGIANGIAFGLFSIPAYVAATLMILFLSVQHHVLPSEGWVAITPSPVEHVKHLIMPVLAITIGQFAIYARLLRTDMVATLQEDYILMAKSKGISDSRILWRHALRPSSLTLLTVAGLNVGSLISGALIIEVIFHLNGIGYQLQQAIATRQYIALQDFVAVIAIVYVLVNFAVDALYRILDPRIRGARIG
jgi:peptide/nickel transport system permease protein